MSKTLKTSIQNKIDYKANWDKATFPALEGELFIYRDHPDSDRPRIKFGTGTEHGSKTVTQLPFTMNDTSGSSVELLPLALPTQNGTVKYNGQTQEPSWTGYNNATMSITGGQASATFPGTYSVQFTPNSGYCWEDNSTIAKTVSWTIVNGDSSLSIQGNPTSITLATFGTTTEYGITYTNASGVSVISSNKNYVIASYSNGKLVLSSGGTKGTATVTISTNPNAYYNQATITISVTNNVSFNEDLDSNSWEDIGNIINSGGAESLWDIGSWKKVNNTGEYIELGGSFKWTTTEPLYAVILGYNHDNTNKTADFGYPFIVRTNSSGQKYAQPCAFTDDKYGTTYINGFSISRYDLSSDKGNWDQFEDEPGSPRGGVAKVLIDILNKLKSKNVPLIEFNMYNPVVTTFTTDYQEDEYNSRSEVSYSSLDYLKTYEIKIPSAKELGLPYDLTKIISDDEFGVHDDAVDHMSQTYPYYQSCKQFYKISGATSASDSIGIETTSAKLWIRDYHHFDNQLWHYDPEQNSFSSYNKSSIYDSTSRSSYENPWNDKTLIEVQPTENYGIFSIFRI